MASKFTTGQWVKFYAQPVWKAKRRVFRGAITNSYFDGTQWKYNISRNKCTYRFIPESDIIGVID